MPSAGQYYVRVTGATADSVQLYDLNLSVAAAVTVLTGDYNHDGVVNAADYTVWCDSLGKTGTGLAADGNGDGVVNAADYTLWQTHFGQIAVGGSGANANLTVPTATCRSLRRDTDDVLSPTTEIVVNSCVRKRCRKRTHSDSETVHHSQEYFRLTNSGIFMGCVPEYV